MFSFVFFFFSLIITNNPFFGMMLRGFSSLLTVGLFLVAGLGNERHRITRFDIVTYCYFLLVTIVSAQTTESVATNVEVTAQFPDNPFGCK